MRISHKLAIFIAIAYCAIGYIATTSQAQPTSSNPHMRAVMSRIGGYIPLEPLGAVVERGPCPGEPTAAGCEYTDSFGIHRIWIVNEFSEDGTTIGHELGHAFDESFLTPGIRNRIEHIMGLPYQPWIRYGGAGDLTCDADRVCPNEWFADGFAACGVDLKPEYFEGLGWGETGSYAFPWTPNLKKQLCRIIIRIGAEAER